MDKMIGKKFRKLTVEKYTGKNKNNCKTYLCRCDCGNTKKVTGIDLRAKRVGSCGCLTKKHGKSSSNLYSIYYSMLDRCYKENSFNYSNYGGRGIKVCNRWLESFENFYEDMGDKPSPEYQLDRINNNGNYEPSNCRWVTPSENAVNRRSKPNKTNHKGLRRDGNAFRTKVTRNKFTRLSLSHSSIEDTIKVRDYYIQQFKYNPEMWIEETKNNTYIKKYEDLPNEFK